MKEGTGQQMQFPRDVGNQATRGTDKQVEHVRRLTGEAGTSAETKESLFSLRCRSWGRADDLRGGGEELRGDGEELRGEVGRRAAWGGCCLPPELR